MATFTNQSKNAASFSNQAKSLVNQFLLLEDGFKLLLEDGFKMILEQSVPGLPTWSTLNKN